MQVNIGGQPYTFSKDVLAQKNTRDGYFKLAKAIFGLRLEQWHALGFWDQTFAPYVLYDGDTAVSSVAVCVNQVLWQNTSKCYVQISTVMTLPEYRNKGLNRWLMEYVLNEWKENCSGIYLLANDTVVGFYPKFGFEEFTEYDFTVSVKKRKGEFRKLDLSLSDDVSLIVRNYRLANPFPFAALKVNNISQFLFHCFHFHQDDIFYHEQANAVVILGQEEGEWVCYDILTDFCGPLDNILGALVKESTEHVRLGFTPAATVHCFAAPSKEADNHLFVFAEKENIFKDHKVLFPLFSRA